MDCAARHSHAIAGPVFLALRAVTRLALPVLLALGISAGQPAFALAAPVVTLRAAAIPLQGFPGTGNILGAGTAIEVEFTIKGTEAFGVVPSPLNEVNFYLPAGTKLHPQGFTTCSPTTLRTLGPEGCPKKSQASPIGEAEASNPIAGELIKEKGTVQAFFAPGGGLLFYAYAPAPVSAEVIAPAHIVKASLPYSYEVITEVEDIKSLPGAPDVSTEFINLKVGAAYRKGGKTISFGTLPTRCPKGGFPIKAELKFASGAIVPVTYKARCPKRRRSRS
jgi:hypothetical protein